METPPVNEPVAAPLADALRPYFVLQTESATAPAASRFEGWWVTAWQAGLPCLQVEAARSLPVGRAMTLAADGDLDAVRRAVADAAFFVTTETTHLEAAARADVPTIYVADGAGALPLPDEIRQFGDDGLRVLSAPTAFRRDLPLSWLHTAIEELAPGSLRADGSESSKCRERLRPYLTGRVADLGHGGHKILPAAVGVDFFKFDPTDWIGDVRDLWFFDEQRFDTVYSSHCLEDLWHPYQALEEWTRILVPGGHLVLYLPLRDFYPNVGTEGANPGHKDDYVPEDVEGFLRDLGHTDIVVSERREAEQSFEVVARKRAGRSWFIMREARPAPEVSVLIVGDASAAPHVDAARLIASVESAHRSLAGVPHEILCTLRSRPPADRLAAVRDLGARIPECLVREDLTPMPYPQRIEKLRRIARGASLIVLSPGTVPLGNALARLHDTRRATDAAMVVPAFGDPAGARLELSQAPGSCVMLDATRWRVGAVECSPYRTPLLWEAWRATFERAGAVTGETDDALVCTPGLGGWPWPGMGIGMLAFDQALLDRAEHPDGRSTAGVEREILVVMLRTLGDAILSVPAVEALAERNPAARITVLTEEAYAWVFERHPSVHEVWATPSSRVSPFHLVEDQLVTAALQARRFDELHLLSDRQDNATYHHSGQTLQGVYAALAGVPEGSDRCPRLHLEPGLCQRMAARLREFGVRERYAVLHTRAGWPEKSIPEPLAMAIVAHLADQHGLPVVVLGGADELVPHAMALNLSGHLTMPESAAVIAGAALFVGPDSGPLHMASSLGIRSLALYAGSSPRVAAPLACGSVSVQAPRSCPLPCGVSPCAQSCGFDGLRAADLTAHLDALVAGTAGNTTWYGRQPAALVDGPEGAIVDPIGAGAAYARPAAEGQVFAPPQAVESVHCALRRAFELGIDQARTAEHERLLGELRSARSTRPLQVDLREALQSTLAALTPAAAVDVLRALAFAAHDRGQPSPCLNYLCTAIAHTAGMTRGEIGRARPAYREVLHELFSLGAAFAGQADSSLATVDQLLALFEAEVGETPPVAALLATFELRREAPARAPGLVRALATVAGEGAGHVHPLQVRRARALELLGAHDHVERELGAHLDQLAETCAAERGETLYLRGSLRVRQGALRAARDDLRAALADLREPRQRSAVQHMLQLIETHLKREVSAEVASP